MNLKRLKKVFRNISSVTILGGMILYLWKNHDQAFTSFDISYSLLVLLGCLILLTWVLNSLPMMIILRLMKCRISFWENLGVLIGTMFGNYLPMRVGTILRMRFFKKSYQIDYMTFIGIMVVRILLMVLVSSIFGIFGIAGQSINNPKVQHSLLGLFLLMAICSITILFLPLLKFEKRKGTLARLFEQLSTAYHLLSANLHCYFILTLIMLAQFFVLGLRLYIAFQAFDKVLSIWDLMLIGPLGTLVTFINFTPGNLGIREWVIGLMAGVTGVELHSGIFAGMLDRSVMMLLTFFLGPACFYKMWHKS